MAGSQKKDNAETQRVLRKRREEKNGEVNSPLQKQDRRRKNGDAVQNKYTDV